MVLSVIVAGTVTLCSYGLNSQDTTLTSYLTGVVASFTGGTGDNQLIRVNLHNHSLALYEDGVLHFSGSVAGTGNPLNRTATPTGEFRILSKERVHTSRLSGVIMPLSMRFYQGYYFHDIPLTPTGTLITTKYSNGCIRLPNATARLMYDWTRIGARVVVYRADLARSDASPTVYYLTDDGYRRPVANPEAFAAHGFTWDRVAVVPYEELAALPLGSPLY
jgi:hypothetical protein